MKIFYWSPFFSNVATIKAVTRSAVSLIKFPQDGKYKVSLIDAIGEWEQNEDILNNKISVIKLSDTNLKNYLPKEGFLKSRISYLIIFFWNFFKLKNLINKEVPDFLIIHLMTSLPIFLSPFFCSKTKVILRISGLPKINIIRYLFWKIYAKKIYKVTCPTKKTYDFLVEKKIFDKEKIFVLSDPIIDMKEFSLKKRQGNNFVPPIKQKYLISIGRLTKQKNFELLINFFYKLSFKYSKFELVIIGEGEDESKLKNLSKKLNIEKKVHFLGYQKNIYKYLKNAECFILTSLWEDPGFVIVEAALSNIPIISSNCPNGPEEIIKKNGYLFQNNNLENLLKKFDEFLSTNKDSIYKNKLMLKKRIKKFSMFQHYKKLSEIIN
ncbi:glycosyltransferase [Candidatus Pelagibacter sp.]|nr:glycosyltransferase [Candidatus Pelagibacter sp.]